LKKSAQKTFGDLGHGRLKHLGSVSQKFFGSSFKKRTAFLLL
jgi:hypothetical protein